MLKSLSDYSFLKLLKTTSIMSNISSMPIANVATTKTEKSQLESSHEENEAFVNKKQKLDNNDQDNPKDQPELSKETISDETKSKEANNNLIKKRKYALLIGYSGEGYFGLQRNPSLKINHQFRTIEDEIVDALVRIKSIPQNHADEMFKMSFQRAARTDKGVSAAENLLSLKMEMADDTLDKLNNELPKKIRVFGYNKVTQSFDCKNNCDGRTYTYILPTFAFCPIEQNLTEDYRVTDEIIDKVNETLRILTGTHNFHNFTSGRKYTDPSSKRYILTFECSKPFIKDGYEFAVIKVRGQSFMLHQIRKMVGMVIAVIRGYASLETIESCWSAYKIDVPTAPALGLMLDKLHYDKYNRKYGKDGIHKPIEWKELEEQIESFKHEYIFSNMIQKEIETKSMFKWLSRLCISHFGPLDPKYMKGYYTGIGRALYLLDKMNNKTEDEEEENGIGDD